MYACACLNSVFQSLIQGALGLPTTARAATTVHTMNFGGPGDAPVRDLTLPQASSSLAATALALTHVLHHMWQQNPLATLMQSLMGGATGAAMPNRAGMQPGSLIADPVRKQILTHTGWRLAAVAVAIVAALLQATMHLGTCRISLISS